MPSRAQLPNLLKETKDPFSCIVCGQTVARDQMNVNQIAHVGCVNLYDAWEAMSTVGLKKDGDT